METWPSVLPAITPEFGGEKQSASIRTDMESGTTRQQRRFSVDTHNFTISVAMSDAQKAIFEAWAFYKLNSANDYFNMPLPITGGQGSLQTCKVRFVEGAYSLQHLDGQWVLSGTLETDASPLMSLAALNSALGS